MIAISADKTEHAFQKKLAYHQWPDNYCDSSGMACVNFTNYGVLGVPTLFLLDQEGMVVKKTAMVDELITSLTRQIQLIRVEYCYPRQTAKRLSRKVFTS